MSKVSASSLKSNKGDSRRKVSSISSLQKQLINPDSDISIAVIGSPPVLQWAEWNDSDVNNENWDCRVIDNRKKQTTNPIVSSSLSEILLFEDEPLPLPASWKVHAWKRPAEIFITGDNDLILYDETHEPTIHELVSLNQHLVQSEFIRSFLSAIFTVCHLADHDTFPIEGESTTFVSNTKHLPWRPWHHIYSLCKAGRNINHKPLINPSGKYITRLYFMGCWRKIMVDDKIPVDIDGKVLLPLTSEKNELWSLLLAKAMLKVACLTWSNKEELVDFNPVHCLTGWIVEECNTDTMNVDKLWEMCNNFVKHFSKKNTEKMEETRNGAVNDYNFHGSQIWPSFKSPKLSRSTVGRSITDTSNSKTLRTSRREKGILKNRYLKGSMMSTKKKLAFKHSPEIGSRCKGMSKISSMTKSSNIDTDKAATQDGSPSKTTTHTLEEDKHNTGPVLFGQLSKHWPSTTNVSSALYESPLNLGHPFLILQTRDTKFVCQKQRPGFPVWKRHRWIDWATRRGIFDPDLLLPFRSVQIVSVFSDWFAKIEEKDTPDALNTSRRVEGIHASGDQGDGCSDHNITSTVSHDHKREEPSSHGHDISATSRECLNANTLRVKDAAGDVVGPRETSFKKRNGHESKATFLSTGSGMRLSYMDTIQSHGSSQYVKPAQDDEAAAVPKCGAAIWTDFNHIWTSIDKMQVFYKPSGFRYKMNIANFTLNRETTVLKRRIEGDKNTLVDAIQSVTVPFSIQRSRNDGIYLKLDSLDCISMFFMLCTVPRDVSQPMKNSINIVSYDQGDLVNEPDASRYIPRPKTTKVNVVIEIYNWASNQFNDSVLVLETVGNKSATLNLGKGRYTLRAWIKTNTAFVLTCLSDTAIIAGNRYKIDNVISSESERLAYFSQELRNKLTYMIVTFGKQQFKSALHAAFQTINDMCTNINKEFIHDVFMDAVVATVKHFTAKDLNEYLFALRALFVNVSLGLNKKVNPITDDVVTEVFGSYTEGESTENQVIDYDKYTEDDWMTTQAFWSARPSLQGKYQDAAYLIQATWKRYCAMKLLKIHYNTQSKEHKLVVEKLKTLHETLFRSSTYSDFISRLLTTMLEQAPDVAKWLPLYHDFGFIVKVETWRGVLVNISQPLWIPVVRLVVNCHSVTPIVGAVNVICQYTKFMTRVIDNDNYIEKPRQVFNVEPCTYTKNIHGYTLFVYAWSEIPHRKDIQWKVEIVSLKNSPNLHSCTTPDKEVICSINTPPALMTLEVSNYYIPNRENIMCRLLIKVKAKMLTSFRLTSSFREVRFTVCLQDKDGFPLMHAQAEEGAVIIPAFFLEKETKSKDTLYIIEAKIIKDSWPLTRQEWVVQERLKNEYVLHKERIVVYKLTSRPNVFTSPGKKPDVLKQQTETKKPLESKKPANLTKKKKDSEVIEFQIEKPFWTLQTVIEHRQRDFIKVQQDNRREEAVKTMKQAWEAADPGRAKRSHDLRNAYIEEIHGTVHDKLSPPRQIQSRKKLLGKNKSEALMKPLKEAEAEDECTVRFHKTPIEFAVAHSKTHFLKTIAEYFVSTGEEPRVKTREVYERELEEKRKQEEEFREERYRDGEEMTHLLEEQRRKHRLMYGYYAKIRHESSLLMQPAYEMRDAFVKEILEEDEDRKRVEALMKKWMKKRTKKLSSKKTLKKSSRKSSPQKKKTSRKSSRKSSPQKKDKKSKKTHGSPVKSRK